MYWLNGKTHIKGYEAVVCDAMLRWHRLIGLCNRRSSRWWNSRWNKPYYIHCYYSELSVVRCDATKNAMFNALKSRSNTSAMLYYMTGTVSHDRPPSGPPIYCRRLYSIAVESERDTETVATLIRCSLFINILKSGSYLFYETSFNIKRVNVEAKSKSGFWKPGYIDQISASESVISWNRSQIELSFMKGRRRQRQRKSQISDHCVIAMAWHNSGAGIALIEQSWSISQTYLIKA